MGDGFASALAGQRIARLQYEVSALRTERDMAEEELERLMRAVRYAVEHGELEVLRPCVEAEQIRAVLREQGEEEDHDLPF